MGAFFAFVDVATGGTVEGATVRRAVDVVIAAVDETGGPVAGQPRVLGAREDVAPPAREGRTPTLGGDVLLAR